MNKLVPSALIIQSLLLLAKIFLYCDSLVDSYAWEGHEWLFRLEMVLSHAIYIYFTTLLVLVKYPLAIYFHLQQKELGLQILFKVYH